jgi:hypothetical protein
MGQKKKKKQSGSEELEEEEKEFKPQHLRKYLINMEIRESSCFKNEN